MTRPREFRIAGNERGATVVVVAISLVVIMSMAALAIDLGMLFTARGETQRAADAAALAGASEYLDPLPTEAGAEARARRYAELNYIRGNKGDADELDITVEHDAQRVTVRIQQAHDTWFARIMGINSANVAALAVARVINSGTAGCIKPFAIPHDTYKDADIFSKVLLWESRSQGQGGGNNSEDDEVGHDAFLLVGNAISTPGVGRDIYRMITDTTCEFSNISVGNDVPAKPGNNTLGNVRGGLRDLDTEYGKLTWSPDGPYDGFNKPDYRSDPRVSLIPMYDPDSYTPPGTSNVNITGFLQVAVLSDLVTCRDTPNSSNPCAFPGNGNRQQLYAVILPSVGLSDGCAGANNCSDIHRVLQLIK